MKFPSCPLPVWRDLYDKAIAFRDIASWKWMPDSAVFGVQNIDSDEVGYCCVLGELAEVFGLVVYLGSEGLEVHRQIQSGKLRGNSPEAIYGQTCLTAWFSNRGDLDKNDVATVKQLGYNFKGRNMWPQFRSMRPGYYPWPVNEHEARFLTHCLDQARFVALGLRHQPGLLDGPKKNHYLVRVPRRDQAEDGSAARAAMAPRDFQAEAPEQPGLFADRVTHDELAWRSEWRVPAPLAPAALPSFPLDELRLERLRNNCQTQGEGWEIDAFYSPSAIDGDERPYFPYTYLCVDHRSAMILDTVLAEPTKWPSEFPQALLAAIERTHCLPRAFWLRNGPLLELLRPLAARLGVNLIVVKKLPSLDLAKRELMKFLQRQ